MIVPDLEELLALRGAAHGLSLHGRKAARSAPLGVHSSAQRGRGLEFQEVRPYVAGDDPRNIDWRVTARRGRPHTKLFREERERPVWLLVDLQPGLFFGTRRQLKSALVARTAALLAWTASLGGDRVGAVIAHGAGETRILPARARQTGVLPLLDALLQSQPKAPGEPAPLALEGALRALLPLARPGSQSSPSATSPACGKRQRASGRRSPHTAICDSSGSPTPWRKKGCPTAASAPACPAGCASWKALACGSAGARLGASVRRASPTCHNTMRPR